MLPAAIPRSREDDFAADVLDRRRALAERAAGRALPHLLEGRPVPPGEARGNVENLVGFAQVPVGLVGPLTLEGAGGRRTVYVPMATLEGALVASHARGARLVSEGRDGPVRARVTRSRLSQRPVLLYDDAAAAERAAEVARAAREELRALTAGVTRHGELVDVRPAALGRRLVLGLEFTTGDAVGINMAAHAAELCSRAIAERTGARERWVHGQDVEKRANARALIEGRGRSAVADVVVPRASLERLTRATPEQMVRLHRTYCAGFAQLGTHNWLIQSANGLAAVFLACGQDVAYLTESATGWLDLDLTPEGDLYASATLPSLLVGTVGGGTAVGTAAECLDLLGCRGAGGADALAEVLAAVVLAGDLSLAASFCTHEFVDAHERLGRNRPAHPPAHLEERP